jgi:hypothetical protein
LAIILVLNSVRPALPTNPRTSIEMVDIRLRRIHNHLGVRHLLCFAAQGKERDENWQRISDV